ncbi:STAS domain-containing protein [Rossellomorea vietnamensis]
MVRGGREPLIIEDLLKFDETSNMEVTKNLGGGSLIGMPIYYSDGTNFGTLCGMDLRPHHFTEEHISLFKAMAKLLENVLNLERANHRVQALSAPLVPISDTVAILPVIGDVDEDRTNRIMEHSLSQSLKQGLEYMIFDLSGLVTIDECSAFNLLKIGQSLKLLGVRMIITGVRPELALKAVQSGSDLDQIHTESNLSDALRYIGYHLEKI